MTDIEKIVEVLARADACFDGFCGTRRAHTVAAEILKVMADVYSERHRLREIVRRQRDCLVHCANLHSADPASQIEEIDDLIGKNPQEIRIRRIKDAYPDLELDEAAKTYAGGRGL